MNGKETDSPLPQAGEGQGARAGRDSARDAREGFSLLEVILALAILTGAVAVLGEAARHSMRNAQVARDLTRAQLLCEGKMAEISAGLASLDPVQGAVLELTPQEQSQEESQEEPEWLYSLSVDQVDQEGLVAVRVTVTRNQPPEKRPVEFSLVRWMIDTSSTTSTTE